MSAAKCPQTERVVQTFPGPPDETLSSHLRGCPRCQAEWAALAELRRLALALPVDQPDAERRDAVRAKLLFQAERLRQQRPPDPASVPPSSDRWRWRPLGWLAAAAVLMLLGLWGWLRAPLGGQATASEVAQRTRHGTHPPAESPSAHPAQRAQIHPLGLADFRREPLGAGDSVGEIVQLRHGGVQIAVAKLASGARFIVRVGESEVEVKGTLFTVTAEHDRLLAVSVVHGLVEVRPARRPSVLLSAGQTWQDSGPAHVAPAEHAAGTSDGKRPVRAALPAAAESAPPRRARLAAEPAGTRSPPRAAPGTAAAVRVGAPPLGPAASGSEHPEPAREPPRAPPLVSPAEKAFLTGFAALKQGQFSQAASDLDRAISLAPDGAIAEDARFWSGVAWARAGRSREAMASLRAFLAKHPHSARQPEVAAALGWMLIRERKLDEAERVVLSAGPHRTAEVSESLRSALSAIRATRRPP
jgi:TolA-binding protein